MYEYVAAALPLAEAAAPAPPPSATRPGSGRGEPPRADSARLSRRIGPGLTPLDTSAAFPAFEKSKEHHGEWSQSTDQLVPNLSSRRKGAVEADGKVTVCKGTPRETCAAEPRV
jgi:hypothetical protein